MPALHLSVLNLPEQYEPLRVPILWEVHLTPAETHSVANHQSCAHCASESCSQRVSASSPFDKSLSDQSLVILENLWNQAAWSQAIAPAKCTGSQWGYSISSRPGHRTSSSNNAKSAQQAPAKASMALCCRRVAICVLAFTVWNWWGCDWGGAGLWVLQALRNGTLGPKP